MKNSNSIFKMFAGILIGISAILFLTLNFWGREIYKVICSIVLGTIIGMFIADYKLTIQIFKNVIRNSWNLVVQIYKYFSGINLKMPQITKKDLLRFYLKTSSFVKSLGLSAFFVLTILRINFASLNDGLCALIMMGLICLLSFYLTFLWADKSIFDSIFQGLSFDELVEIAEEKGLLYIEWKFLQGFIFLNWWIIKKTTIVGGFTIFTLVVTTLLSVLCVPVFFLKELWKSQKMLTVVLSIVLGGIMGTVFRSYFYGISSGFLVAILSLAFGQIFSKVKLFFYWDNLLANRDLWKKVISV